MHIFLSVGEPSGDQHAAHLMRELQTRQPDLRVSGFGGPLMEQAGLNSLFRLTDLAVMGLLKVLPLIGKFYALVRQAERFFAEQKPDAVVLVDFPGFNWWIARKAKAAGIPVFYYLPPQLWAWASWRVNRVRKYVDHVISALPFERDWYQQQGIAVDYVGHPFFDEISDHPLDEKLIESWRTGRRRIVALLPGSRNQEVARNWPIILEAARRLHADHPDVTFLAACFRDQHRRACLTEFLVKCPTLPVQFFVGKTSEIIEVADCAMMVSGSVSLELLARGTPAAVVYSLSRGMNVLRHLLLRCRYISLPNLIADREIMPEFISVGSPEPAIRGLHTSVCRWLDSPDALQQVRDELAETGIGVQETGATVRTAETILRYLGASSPDIVETETRRAA
ncbi:lipid-A-disaccharide synthase [bacterium]|nr:lipid-A-disaccharide synthase [bacterium]